MDSEPDGTDELRSLDVDRILEPLDEDALPATTDEIIADLGEVEIGYPGGSSETLESVLITSGRETYDTLDDLRLAVLNGVQRDAVGRPRYSDRDPPDVAEDRDLEQSF